MSDITRSISPTLKDAMKKMNFPWLCSNLRDVKTGEILAKTVNANGEATGITKLIRYWNTDQDRIIKILDPRTDQWTVFKSGRSKARKLNDLKHKIPLLSLSAHFDPIKFRFGSRPFTFV